MSSRALTSPPVPPTESLLDTVLSSLNDAVVAASASGRILFWNPGAERMFGWTESEALERHIADLMPERFRAAHIAAVAHLAETGEERLIGRSVQLVGLHRSGREIPVEISLGRFVAGAESYFTAVIRDITERERVARYRAAEEGVTRVLAEAATLEEAQGRLLAVTGEALGWELGAIWLVDPEGEGLRNAGFWRSPDLPADSAFEQATRSATVAAGEDLPGRVWQSRVPEWIADAERDPGFPRRELAAELGLHGAIALPILADGEAIGALEFHVRRFSEPDNELLELFATLATQVGLFVKRRLAEEQLERTLEELRQRAAELERSNADLEQFAYVASHDLAEPLRMVSGFVQLLASRYKGRLDSDADEFIGYTVDGVARMRALIDDILIYSRLQRAERVREPVDVGAVVDRLRSVLAPTLSEREAEVIADPDLPIIEADPRQVEQLLQNLLTNAIKFTAPEVKPVVRVGAHREADGWCLTVADNGIGIDPKYAERIFKMFQRLHSREAYPGTGIGLAICKKIAERHGGTVWVVPNPEGGSIFHVTISDDRSRQR